MSFTIALLLATGHTIEAQLRLEDLTATLVEHLHLAHDFRDGFAN